MYCLQPVYSQCENKGKEEKKEIKKEKEDGKKERQKERKIERKIERKKERQKERQKQRKTERNIERKKNRKKDRKKEIQKERKIERKKERKIETRQKERKKVRRKEINERKKEGISNSLLTKSHIVLPATMPLGVPLYELAQNLLLSRSCTLRVKNMAQVPVECENWIHGAPTTAILIDIYRILDSDFGGNKCVASIENRP